MKESLMNESNENQGMDSNNEKLIYEGEKNSLKDDIYTIFINNKDMNDQQEVNYIDTSKYKWSNFFAKILMEQFSRLVNVYFLIIAIMQSVKELSYSGGNPLILLPLSIIIVLNGLKDMYEDYNRRKSDNKENNSECYIYDSIKGFERKKWSDIKLGDIIKVNKNQQFPADLLLLSSSDKKGICYVETKNLDGETNLKFKEANNIIHSKIYSKEDKNLSNLFYVCITKPPNELIYKFDATLYETKHDGTIINPKKFELINNKSFLLRGSILSQTDFIIGGAIYIGPHTKSMINSPEIKTKRSSLEIMMSKQVMIIFIFQIIISFILALVYTIIYFQDSKEFKKYYYDVNDDGGFLEILFTMTGTWIIICTNFVPISLMITMETIKFFQAMFIQWDIDMYEIGTLNGCKVQCSTLNEELGQIKYTCCDKTGTLTKNNMRFKMMSIGGKIYGTLNRKNENKTDNLIYEEIDNDNENEKKDNNWTNSNVDFIEADNTLGEDMENENYELLINEFMLCLCLCNTVIIDTKKKEEEGIIEFQSSSPDEQALVYFAKSQKYILSNKSVDGTITLEIKGKNHNYKLLNILEYTSERKRMSVIVKTESNKYIMYMKGADSILDKLLLSTEKKLDIYKATHEHIKTFAINGLRTLMIAYKELDEDEYNQWNEKYIKIKSKINHTENDIFKLYNEIENELKLIGATAIEDELEDNVDKIINFMLSTGMRVWMLTGDKLDTAKNIAISCKLFKEEMQIVEIGQHLTKEDLKKELINTINGDIAKKKDKNLGLIISSEELENIFANKILLNLFFELAKKCQTVVCSRITPKQKGQLVNLIKTTEHAITLAIDDGANDVGMITEANVGIGIWGKEGTQAARAGDYSITQFSHLKKLLFFHGRECYRKNSWVILYNFYKNILFISPFIWTGFISIFSAVTIYDPVIHQIYNTIYTTVPPVWFAIFNNQYTKEELLSNSCYYIQGIYINALI